MIRTRVFARVLAAGIASMALTAGDASAQKNRGTEFRSLNSDVYQIEIQKDGLVDVFLAGSQPAVFDAFPMVWFADEPSAERMKTDGRWTQRYRVEDRLGDGSGMAQMFKDLEWTLRTYPTRTYFAVQSAYTNTGKKPVTLRALMPWCVGEPGKGAIILGDGTDSAAILTGAMSGQPVLGRLQGASTDAIALWNPKTGRSLVAGFVTQNRATTRFEVSGAKAGDVTALYAFRAVCEFDPPVVVEPGEQVLSEVLYLAFAESEPVTGLQRYARAVNIANKVGEQPAPFRAWTAPVSALGTIGPSLGNARELVSIADVPFVLFGEPGSAASAKSGADLASLAAGIDATVSAGYRPALWCDPFVYRADDPLVRARPDLFLDSAAESDTRSLDLGHESAMGLIEEAGQELSMAGIRVVTGIDVDRLVNARFGGERTGTEMVTAGIQALRRGLGAESRIYAASPSLLASILTDGVVSPNGSAIQAVGATSIAPSSVIIDGHAEGGAWNTAAAASMTDSALLLDLESVIRRPDAHGRMDLLFPAASSRSVQADLFFTEHPRVLYARHENAAGVAHQVAVFNWHADAESTTIPLTRLGDPPGTYYTVYDFWAGRYLGTATDRLDVVVAPGDASMLVLRPYVSRPLPLVIGTNLGQTSPNFDVYEYDAGNAQLRIETSGARVYALPLLMPENVSIERVDGFAGDARVRTVGENSRVVYIDVTPDAIGRAGFTLHIRR